MRGCLHGSVTCWQPDASATDMLCLCAMLPPTLHACNRQIMEDFPALYPMVWWLINFSVTYRGHPERLPTCLQRYHVQPYMHEVFDEE
jgi:hypothetical protein